MSMNFEFINIFDYFSGLFPTKHAEKGKFTEMPQLPESYTTVVLKEFLRPWILDSSIFLIMFLSSFF